MKILSPYIHKVDDRGLFLGILQESWIREINYIETTAGQIRGNHYHTKTQEMFFIIEGKIEVRVYNIKTGGKEENIFKKGDVFIVYPYEVHTFYTLTESKWINMLSQPIQKGNPDFHKYEPNLMKEKDEV